MQKPFSSLGYRVEKDGTVRPILITPIMRQHFIAPKAEPRKGYFELLKENERAADGTGTI